MQVSGRFAQNHVAKEFKRVLFGACVLHRVELCTQPQMKCVTGQVPSSQLHIARARLEAAQLQEQLCPEAR